MTHWRVGGVPEHFNLPWQLGVEQGEFAAAGIELSFADYPTGTGAMCADLRNGQLDMAVALTEGLLADMARYPGQNVVVAPFVCSSLNWGVHVGADSVYQQIADLEGQTLAISREGSGSHLMGLLWAHEQGWKAPAFNVVGGLSALEQAVCEGEAAAFLWEQFTTLPRVKAGQLRCLGYQPTPWPCFMIAVRRDLQDHPQLNSLFEVLFSQAQACQTHTEKTLAEIVQRYPLTLQEAQQWFSQLQWAKDRQLPLAELQACYKTLQRLGLISVHAPALETHLVT